MLLLTIAQSDQAALVGGAAADKKDDVVRRAYDADQSALGIARSLHDDALASYALGYTGQLYESQRRYADALVLTRQALFLAQQQQSEDASIAGNGRAAAFLRR